MGAHCYFIYDGEQKSSYQVKFRLFDDYDLSFVRYDGKYLSKEKSSWGNSKYISFYTVSEPDSICNEIKDPFQKRMSCIGKINNCMYCQDENTCKECKEEFSLVNGQCLPLTNYQDNLKYFTPDNGINFFLCSSVIDYCEECYYEYFSFNNFHCTKCSDGLNLDESYECDISQHIIPITNSLSGKFIDSSCLNENNILNCHLHNIEIPNFSCWKFKDIFNNKEHCIIYPDNEIIQKEFYNFYLGISKEELSINSNKNDIMIPEKEIYKKDETITFKGIQDILTDEDKSIINNSNTCYSIFYKGYSNFWLNGNFPNIENPNICFNAIKFSEHNNILDCGFAKISFSYGLKKYNFQTCYFIPNDELSKNIQDFYRRSLIEEMLGKDGTFGKTIKNKNNNENIIRKLQENNEISFEMTIQNKNGKVLKYDSKLYNITVVKDKSTDDDNSEFDRFKPDNSNHLKFNWLIAIYIILLLV